MNGCAEVVTAPVAVRFGARRISRSPPYDPLYPIFITTPIGSVANDEALLKKLQLIEADLCKTWLANRYHKLPEQDRVKILVAFEGQRRLGTRHAHILVYLPKPKRKLLKSITAM